MTAASTALGPITSSRRVRLRSITPEDYDWLYKVAVGSPSSWRWRHRGSTPNPEGFVNSMWADALLLLLAERRSDGAPIGYLSATRADFRNGHCYMSAFSVDAFQRTLFAAEAGALFMTHLLSLFPFRKIYFEIPEFNADQMGHSLDLVGEIEGRLRDYEYFDGRHWDTLIVSVSRQRVGDLLAPLVGRSLTPHHQGNP